MKKIERLRRQQLVEVNTSPTPEGAMTLSEAQKLYTFEGFSAPYVVVERKSDGVKGTLAFKHSPRVYFNFKEDK
jgi:hypothetical protein